MRKHLQILAILNIVSGSLGVLGALIVLAVFGGLTTIIHYDGSGDPDAELALGTVGAFVFLVLIITSIPSIVAGIALLQFKEWARILALIVSALHLLNIPFGTALGIYGLWVLLSQESIALLHPSGGSLRISVENP